MGIVLWLKRYLFVTIGFVVFVIKFVIVFAFRGADVFDFTHPRDTRPAS